MLHIVKSYSTDLQSSWSGHVLTSTPSSDSLQVTPQHTPQTILTQWRGTEPQLLFVVHETNREMRAKIVSSPLPNSQMEEMCHSLGLLTSPILLKDT